MLSREHRLTKNKDIERVAKHGHSFFTKIFSVRFLQNNLPISRFAVVSGLRVHKKATKRNKPKRQIREILRKNLPAIKNGFDLVVTAKREILDQKYQEIEKTLSYALGSARLLK